MIWQKKKSPLALKLSNFNNLDLRFVCEIVCILINISSTAAASNGTVWLPEIKLFDCLYFLVWGVQTFALAYIKKVRKKQFVKISTRVIDHFNRWHVKNTFYFFFFCVIFFTWKLNEDKLYLFIYYAVLCILNVVTMEMSHICIGNWHKQTNKQINNKHFCAAVRMLSCLSNAVSCRITTSSGRLKALKCVWVCH